MTHPFDLIFTIVPIPSAFHHMRQLEKMEPGEEPSGETAYPMSKPEPDVQDFLFTKQYSTISNTSSSRGRRGKRTAA